MNFKPGKDEKQIRNAVTSNEKSYEKRKYHKRNLREI